MNNRYNEKLISYFEGLELAELHKASSFGDGYIYDIYCCTIDLNNTSIVSCEKIGEDYEKNIITNVNSEDGKIFKVTFGAWKARMYPENDALYILEKVLREHQK